MEKEWNAILEQYICNVISPDGRDTFESSPKIINKIVTAADIRTNDTILDIGCGWGNVTRACAAQTNQTVIGIEPDIKNMEEARYRSKDYDIRYMQGFFEKPGYTGKADVIVSSLVFHQVKYKYKSLALKNIKKLLNTSGRFILCDVMILFDAKQDPVKFNRVYRYLLKKTTPRSIYEKSIAPFMDETHIYTWEDMKAYTPDDFWFCSSDELEEWLQEHDLIVTGQQTICPFFGILTIEPV